MSRGRRKKVKAMQKNRPSEDLEAAKKRFAAAMEEMSPIKLVRAAPVKSVGAALFAGALTAFATGSLRALPLPLRDIYTICSRLYRASNRP